MADKLALHEKLELHEVLAFKNLCLTKAATMSALVGCKELKEILSTDVVEGRHHVERLSNLLKKEGSH